MVEDRPLGSWKSLFKGILGGSLISSGIFFLEFGIATQIALFIIGFLITLDSVISKTEEIYPLSVVLGFIFGFFVALFAVIGQVAFHYTMVIFILAVLLYLARLVIRLNRR